MTNGNIFLTGLLSIVLASTGAAQGRGQGGGGPQQGGGGSQGAGPQSGGPQRGDQGVGRPDDSPRGGPPSPGQRAGTGDQRRDRIQATDRQRDHHAAGTQSANRVRERAHQLADAAKGGGANNEEFRRLHQQLHEEIRLMQQERDRFVNDLNEDQRSALESRLRNMDKARDRLTERLRLLDEEFAKPELDRRRIRSHANNVEKAMSEWQKHYRSAGSDMGIRS